MITRLDLHHFKCFSLLKLPLAPLTLLSGTNASGKSSVLQVLASLHQTIREHEWSTRLMLNGNAVRLGTVADVVDQVDGGRTLRVAVHDEDGLHEWAFTGERTQLSMQVAYAAAGQKCEKDPERLRWLLPVSCSHRSLPHRLRDLTTYLTAERLGRQDRCYPLDDPQLAPVVGRAGEHAVSVLQSGAETPVVPRLAVDGIPPTRLPQVEVRMAGFFPGCELAMKTVLRASAVRLGVRTSRDTGFHMKPHPLHPTWKECQVMP